MGEGKGLQGINGWLIVFSLFFIFIIGSYLYNLVYQQTYTALNYLISIGFIFFAIYVLYLFFNRKKEAPVMVLYMLIVHVILGLVNSIIFLNQEKIPFQEGLMIIISLPLITQTALALIWFYYIKSSSRVKNTFTD